MPTIYNLPILYSINNLAIQKILKETSNGGDKQLLLIKNTGNLYNHYFLEKYSGMFDQNARLVASDWTPSFIQMQKYRTHLNQLKKLDAIGMEFT